MAIVCLRCKKPTRSTETVYSAARMLRCTRCGTTWFVRDRAADPGSGESPHLAVRRSMRPRFERVVEHDGPGSLGQGWTRPVEPTENGRRVASRASGVLGIGRRLFGRWSGAFCAVAVSGPIALLALQSSVDGAAPAAGAGLESIMTSPQAAVDEVALHLARRPTMVLGIR